MKKTILIIDDDELLSNLISMVLTAKGFGCVQANSGLKGFEVLENLQRHGALDLMQDYR